MSTLTQPIGFAAELIARRHRMMSQLSPSARHRAFPQLYPMPPSGATPIITDTDGDEVETSPNRGRRPFPFSASKAASIIKAVASAWEISPFALTSKGRAWRVSHPRFACVLLMREADFSFPRIARYLGFNDHTSAMHGWHRANELLVVNRDWEWRFNEARAALAQ